MPMNPITLISHARAADPHNTSTITYNAGKPETVVEGEAEGIRMRQPMETVHYREDESDPRCPKCLQWATVWHGSLDRWAAHPMQCQAVSPSQINHRSWR